VRDISPCGGSVLRSAKKRRLAVAVLRRGSRQPHVVQPQTAPPRPSSLKRDSTRREIRPRPFGGLPLIPAATPSASAVSFGLAASGGSVRVLRLRYPTSRRRVRGEELARLKQAMNIAEEAARWLRSCLRRLRDGTDIESEIHNMEQALTAARAAVKPPPEPRTAGQHVSPAGDE